MQVSVKEPSSTPKTQFIIANELKSTLNDLVFLQDTILDGISYIEVLKIFDPENIPPLNDQLMKLDSERVQKSIISLKKEVSDLLNSALGQIFKGSQADLEIVKEDLKLVLSNDFRQSMILKNMRKIKFELQELLLKDDTLKETGDSSHFCSPLGQDNQDPIRNLNKPGNIECQLPQGTTNREDNETQSRMFNLNQRYATEEDNKQTLEEKLGSQMAYSSELIEMQHQFFEFLTASMIQFVGQDINKLSHGYHKIELLLQKSGHNKISIGSFLEQERQDKLDKLKTGQQTPSKYNESAETAAESFSFSKDSLNTPLSTPLSSLIKTGTSNAQKETPNFNFLKGEAASKSKNFFQTPQDDPKNNSKEIPKERKMVFKDGYRVVLQNSNESSFCTLAQFKNDAMHGKALFYQKNKGIYIGEMEKNVKHGFGRYLYKSGDLYVGLRHYEDKHDKSEAGPKYFFNKGSLLERNNWIKGFKQFTRSGKQSKVKIQAAQ